MATLDWDFEEKIRVSLGLSEGVAVASEKRIIGCVDQESGYCDPFQELLTTISPPVIRGAFEAVQRSGEAIIKRAEIANSS